jgi:hypothetical protein
MLFVTFSLTSDSVSRRILRFSAGTTTANTARVKTYSIPDHLMQLETRSPFMATLRHTPITSGNTAFRKAATDQIATSSAVCQTPEHPGWQGTVGGIGGEFRPKDGAGAVITREAKGRIMRRALRTSLLAALRIGVETLASLVPGVDWCGRLEPPGGGWEALSSSCNGRAKP